MIRLKPATDTSFVVLDPAGQPLAGALVQPYYISNEPTPEEVLRHIEARTDAAGRAKFPAVGHDELDTLRVTAKGFGIQSQRYSSPERPLPAENTIRLRPVGRIEGRVTADNPQWVRGVQMVLETERIAGSHAPPWLTDGFAQIESDNHGRFTVPAIANGSLHFRYVHVDEKLPVRPQLPRRLNVAANETTELVLPMTPLVPVRGSVRLKDRDAPASGVEIHIQYGVGQRAVSVSDTQGRFTARVLPGRVRFNVFDKSKKYVQFSSAISHEIPNQTEEFKLPPLELVPAKSITGSVIDERDQPVANVSVYILVANRRYGFGKSDVNGQFTLVGIPTTLDTAAAEYKVSRVRPLPRKRLESKVIKTDPLTIRVQTPPPTDVPRPQARTPREPPKVRLTMRSYDAH